MAKKPYTLLECFHPLSPKETNPRIPHKSKTAINNTQPPLPSINQPIHLLHPPAQLHPPPLLLANPHKQPPHHTRVLPDTVALERFQQLDRAHFSVCVRRREARDENGKDHFAPLDVAIGQDLRGEGEDVRGARGRVSAEGGLVGDGEEALGREHAAARVDCCGLVEEEGLVWGINFL